MKFTLPGTIIILERTPILFDQLLRDLPDDWTHSNEGEKTWSPFDTVGHLIHGEILKSKNITEIDFLRTGIHPDFGTVTLENLLSTWVVHDLDHVVQISRVMAFQYKDEVGPWKNYMRILK